jgi:uncharacterized protein (DUF1015 family)
MTSLLTPFTGFIPSAAHAHRIVGPPSSMLSSEQKNASRLDDLSFRHVVGRGAGAHHAQAMDWLQRCRDLDALRPVDSSVIIHRLTRGAFIATGLIADVSLAAFDTGLVKRHETTIAKSERKMLKYMKSTRIFGNPVALAHYDHPEVAVSLASHTQRDADITFVAIDGMQHSLWVVAGDDAVNLCANFSDVLYITDGHHRLAAASALAAAEDRSDPHIPAGLFAENELKVWAFARAIKDQHVNTADIVNALREKFGLEESSLEVPRPTARQQVGVRIDDRSFVLTIPAALIPADPYDRLDVNLLQNLILEPLFGVTNPRTDSRLSFIADTADDAHDPDSYEAWFLPYPTSVRDVMMVADTGRAMPPKSTYFLPKLPSGLVIRPIDTD